MDLETAQMISQADLKKHLDLVYQKYIAGDERAGAGDIGFLVDNGLNQEQILASLAKMSLDDRQLPLALKFQKEVTGLCPDRPSHWMGLAAIHMDMNAPHDAIDAFLQVIALKPDESVAWKPLIYLLFLTGRLDDADEALGQFKVQTMETGEPDGAVLDHLFRLAGDYNRAAKFNRAMALYDIILKHYPRNARALWGKSAAAFYTSQFDTAEVYCRKAIQANSHITDYHLGYHVILDRKGLIQPSENTTWEPHQIPALVFDHDHDAKAVDVRAYYRPKEICIEVSSACNYKCPVCACGNGRLKRRKPFLNAAEFEAAVDILKTEEYTKFNLFCIGEPFMNPDIYQILEKAVQETDTLDILTNGSLIDVDRLAPFGSKIRLHYSLDSIYWKSYAYYRRCRKSHFDQALENLDRLSRTDIQMVVCVLVMKHNQDHLDDIIGFLEDRNLHYALETVHCSPFDVTADQLPPGLNQADNEGARRYVSPRSYEMLAPDKAAYEKYNTYQFDNATGLYQHTRHLSQCTTGLGFPWLTSDGNVLPCCMEGYVQTVNMGNLFEKKSFSSIWFSPEYILYRNQLLNLSEADRGYCRWCPTAMM